MNMKNDLHDRLWKSFSRWLALRESEGVSKHDLKMRGVREHGDAQHYLRPLLFTRSTLRTYEQTLKQFVDYAKEQGVWRLKDLCPRHMRDWLRGNIEAGYAKKSLDRMRAAAAKLGTLIGKSESFARMSAKCGSMIREAAREGKVGLPKRATPSMKVLQNAVRVLEARDQAGKRGYSLALRLQLETSARMISVTSRMTRDCVLPDSRIRIIGKGGKEQTFRVSSDLHARLKDHFQFRIGPLASYSGYRHAYRRAVEAVGGRVSGTHGARRASIQAFRRERYAELVRNGLRTNASALEADRNSIERLGHGADRADHRLAYLGK